MNMFAARLATFFVDRFFCGIDVLKVEEVFRLQNITRLPLAPPAVAGLINLRGQIVPAIDMRRRLNLPPREFGDAPMNFVVRTDEGPVSLLVDDAGDVMELPSSVFEPAPVNLPAHARDVILGVYKLKETLLLVLDIERISEVGSASQTGLPSRRIDEH